MKERYTALYERLSRDDEQQGESNSILNQKKYLEDYARPKIRIKQDVLICMPGIVISAPDATRISIDKALSDEVNKLGNPRKIRILHLKILGEQYVRVD